MNKENEAKDFKHLEFNDKDLIMFTITDLRLENKKEQVHMVINLKRKIQTELLTTYLPTILLLGITYATTFFKSEYFEASVTVNLTIMLVMTTIFTSKIEELPPTSDTKMIDIWLIFCLLVPFAFTLIQTAIGCYREETSEPKRPEAWSRPVKDGLVVWIYPIYSFYQLKNCRMVKKVVATKVEQLHNQIKRNPKQRQPGKELWIGLQSMEWLLTHSRPFSWQVGCYFQMLSQPVS